MAAASFYGSMSPSAYEAMDPAEFDAYYGELEKLIERQMRFDAAIVGAKFQG